MASDIDELNRTKAVLAGLVLLVAGAVLMVAGRQLPMTPGWDWTSWLPLGELGGVVAVLGVASIWVDRYLAKVKAKADRAMLRELFREEASTMVDAVVQGFAVKPEDLKRVATPELLDQIITNSLSLRLGDEDFAREIYTDIRDQAVRATERWHDANVSIHLAPLYRGSDTGGVTTDPLYVVTVRWEYTVVPAHQTRRFACVGTREDYDELSHDPGETSAWYFAPKEGIAASDKEAFELLQFAVDGEQKKIHRSTRRAGQIYSVNLGTEVIRNQRPVTLAFTYRTVVKHGSHVLHFDIEQPTRNISVEFDYGDTTIERVSVLDLIPSSRPTRTERTPEQVPARVVRVDYDGWLFPRSGVAFVWVEEQ